MKVLLKKTASIGLASVLVAAGDAANSAQTAAIPCWEDPAVSRVNTLAPRDELVPFANETAARAWANLERPREDSPYVMSLNGDWEFEWRARPDSAAVRRGRIAVPGCWQLQGDYDPPIYTNYTYPHVNNPPHIMEDPPTNFTQYVYRNPLGVYRRTFKLPDRWKGRRIVMRFNGVASAFFLRMNGREVGYAEDSRMPAEFDVTPYLDKSGNLVEVSVYRWCDGSYLEDQDFWRLSGIYRDVWLQAEGIDTPHDVRDAAHLPPVANPEKWSPENPKLYVRTWQSANGDWYAWADGYRDIAISNSVVYVNGERLVVRGVNRHEMSPRGGYALTHEEMERDVRLIKEYGFNAVRTCHYPNDSYWYRLCDKYGLLLVCEANVECHGSGQGNARRSLACRKEWRGSFVERGVNMVKTYRHHPSIYFWSLGNECWEGENLQAEYDAIKSIDESRPVQYSTDRPVPYSDILAPMYWPAARCEGYVTNAPPKPLVQCEYLHAMGNAGGSQESHWELVARNRHYQGGFIWDFADQALLGADGNLKYGGDFGDSPNDGGFCCNGIFDAFRRPHGSALEARALNLGASSLSLPNAPGATLRQSASLRARTRDRQIGDIVFKPNFYRAPTDNDRGWKMPSVCRIWKNATETGKVPDGCTSDLATQELPDGSLKVEWLFVAAEGLPDIPRAGLTFRVCGGTNTLVRWRGRGPWENYCDRRAATNVGEWQMSVAELNPNNYVIPGEQGYRTETTRLEIGTLVVEAADGSSFGFNVWPWTQQDLEHARHVEELPEPDGTLTVNIDAAQMGVGGDDSWSAHARALPQFCVHSGRKYRLSLILHEEEP